VACAVEGAARAYPRATHKGLEALFRVFRRRSVFCQLWWQRLLFEPVGVDIECVTIIVSTFMLGLGSGALAAGEIADRYQARRVELIALIERAAALLGECSPWLIHAASAAVVNSKGENP
jgi:MFS family permease